MGVSNWYAMIKLPGEWISLIRYEQMVNYINYGDDPSISEIVSKPSLNPNDKKYLKNQYKPFKL